MESKHLARPAALPGGFLPPVPAVSMSPLTTTSGPSQPSPPLRLAEALGRSPSPTLRVPGPRPSVQEVERVVCSTPVVFQVPQQILQVARTQSLPCRRVTEPISPRLLPRVLGAMFGGPCANVEPDTLRDLVDGCTARLGEEEIPRLLDQVVTLSRSLSSMQLYALLSGLAIALPAAPRARCRDHLLACLLDPDAGFNARDLARLTLSATLAWGGEGMAAPDLQAFLAVLAQAPGVHDADRVCAILEGHCEGLSLDEGTSAYLIEAVVAGICQGVGLLENPADAELLMRRLAVAAGGSRMGVAMRARFVDALLNEPDLPVEQLGLMLLGLAVALEAPMPIRPLATGPRTPPLMPAPLDTKDGKSRQGATAGELAAATPVLPSLSSLLAASLELSESQLARWGQAVGAALRPEGEEGLAEIEQALREVGRVMDAGRLTALACGLAAGLADGCTQDRTRLKLDLLQGMILGLPEVGQRRAVRLGFRLAMDPIAATAELDDRIGWLQLVWHLPGVLNARTTALWFGQVLALKDPAAVRAQLLATLVAHGAAHLEEGAIRQARDLALSADASAVPGIYGAWIETGLPTELFDHTLSPSADLRVERHRIARRLSLVKQELVALPELGCDGPLRVRLRSLLVGWSKDLQRGLEAAAKDAKGSFSGLPPAAR